MPLAQNRLLRADDSAAGPGCCSPGTPPQALVLGSAVVHSPMVRQSSAQRSFDQALGSCSLADSPAGSVDGALPGDAAQTSAAAAPDSEGRSTESDKVGPDAFQLMRVVGQGAFGKVRPPVQGPTRAPKLSA